MTIELRLLTPSDVEDLYPRLRLEDQEECIVLGSNPRECLLMGAFDNLFVGVSRGRAYGLWSVAEPRCVNAHDRCYEGGPCPLCEPKTAPRLIGALGFTSSGYLWALSEKFSRKDLKELWLRTREITTWLLQEAKRRGVFTEDYAPYFQNIIHTRNKVALRWLQRSGVFAVFPENAVEVGNDVFYPFRTLLPFEIQAHSVASSLN